MSEDQDKPGAARPKAAPGADGVTNRHVARGLGTTLISRMGGIIEIVAQPLYVALYGLASFGLYSVIWAVINLFENVFDLGMTSALQRTVPQAEDDQAAVACLRTALLVGVGCCLIVAIICIMAADPLASYLNVAATDRDLVAPSIRLFAMALPLWAFVEIATSALRARHLFGAEIRLRIIWEQVIRLVLAVILWMAGFGLTGLFIAHLVSLGITAVLSVRLLARHYDLSLLARGPWFGAESGETIKAGLAVLPANGLARLFGDAPTLVLNLILPGAAGASAAALFTIGRKIASVVQLVRTAFAYVLAPLASSAKRHDASTVQGLYAYSTRLITVIVLPVAFVISAGLLPILALFGPEARTARLAVIILIAGRAVEAIVGASVPVQQVVSSYVRQIYASAAGFVIACIAGWWLVRWDPLAGITSAVAIGIVAAAYIPLMQLWHYDRLQPFDRRFPRLLAIALLCGLAGMAIALPLAELPNWIALPLLLPVLLAATWCSLKFALPHEDHVALGKTGRKLRLTRQ
ncbi:MAG: oligosaccharide flippase family protein [Blastomonas sp.]